MTAKYFAGIVLGDAARQHRAGGGLDVEREFAEHVTDLVGVDIFRLDLRKHARVEGRAMRAGHRGVFGDGHRGVSGPERHVGQRYRLGDIGGALAPSPPRSGAAARPGKRGKPGQRQGGGEGAARDDQRFAPEIGAVRALTTPEMWLFASLKPQLWQWRAAFAETGREQAQFRLIDGAEPRQRRPQFLVLDRRQGFGDFAPPPRDRAARAALGRSRRDSGACRSASRPTALQPKKRLTRSRITSEACWISSAIGPSTRSTRVAGSCGWPSTGRGHWIFSGSE